MATGDRIDTQMSTGDASKISQCSGPVDNHTAVQIRHTSEVSSSDAVYAQVKSDLENAGFALVRLLRINNTDLLEKFRLESDHLKKLKQKDKDFQLNIQNLYHGTTAPLDQICDEGLDERLSRSGRFGRGIYLSDDPSKCCQYTESRSREPYLLRCQVILGDIKEYQPGEHDITLKMEPPKCVSDGKQVYYDSVKGHPAGHTEYVIYDKRRVLLEYIAFYSGPSLARSSRRRRTRSGQSDPGASRSRSGSHERTSSSGSDFGSPGGSREGSPAGSPRAESLPNVTPRKRVEGAPAQPPAGPDNSPSASASRLSASSFDRVAIQRSAEEQQRLAFKQMLDLKGNISESHMNDLISSWTSTYGSIPLENPSGGGSDPVTFDPIIDDDEDDPVLQVKRKLVQDFKVVTCCPDDDLCLQFIEQYNMDLNAAIEAFFNSN